MRIAVFCVLALAACDGLSSDVASVDVSPDTIVARLSVPDGVGCVRLRLTGPRNRNYVEPVVAGRDFTLDLGHLPLGSYSLSGEAYEAICPATGDMVWSAAATPFEVASGDAGVEVALAFLRHPDVVVGGDFAPSIIQIHAERSLVMALSDDRHLYAWGQSEGDYLHAADGDPHRMSQFDGTVRFAMQPGLLCAIDGAGAVRCAGTNTSGQLPGVQSGGSKNPVLVPLPGPAVAVTVGPACCALLDDGGLYCWGDTTGLPTYACAGPGCEPTRHDFNGAAADIAGNGLPTILFADGRAFMRYGLDAKFLDRADAIFDSQVPAARAPSGDIYFKLSNNWPTAAPDLFGMVDVAWAYQTTCGIDASGSLYCRGDEPGTGAANAPDLEWVAAGARDVTIAQDVVCFSDVNGGAWCWGANGSGQLGTGDRQARFVPTRVKL